MINLLDLIPDDQGASLIGHGLAARLHRQEPSLLLRPEERDRAEVWLAEEPQLGGYLLSVA